MRTKEYAVASTEVIEIWKYVLDEYIQKIKVQK